MAQPFVVALDPAEMAERFGAVPDDEPSTEDVDSVVQAHALDDRRHLVERFLDLIPPDEADVYELTLLGCRQSDLAIVFDVTQAAISYRLKRAIQRLKYLADLPEGIEEDLEFFLPEVLTDERSLMIVREMWVLTSQSHVAAKLGITQGQTRHRFLNAVARVERAAETDPKFKNLAIALRKLSQNFNVLTDVHGCGVRKFEDRPLEF